MIVVESRSQPPYLRRAWIRIRYPPSYLPPASLLPSPFPSFEVAQKHDRSNSKKDSWVERERETQNATRSPKGRLGGKKKVVPVKTQFLPIPLLLLRSNRRSNSFPMKSRISFSSPPLPFAFGWKTEKLGTERKEGERERERELALSGCLHVHDGTFGYTQVAYVLTPKKKKGDQAVKSFRLFLFSLSLLLSTPA